MIKLSRTISFINKQSALNFIANFQTFATNQQNKNGQKDQQTNKGRQVDNKVKIDPKYLHKSAALYDKYKQQREKPLLTLDDYQVKYSWILQRVPIFYPYQKQYFTYYKNRFNLSKRAGFYLNLPKQLIIEEGDYLFKEYERVNPENIPSHQVVINGQTKYYRQNSRYWRYTDPQVIDQKSIQTNSSDNVFFIVKNAQGNWEFPTRIFLQKETHQQFFKSFAQELFGGQAFPNIYFSTKKPIYCVKQERQELEKGIGIKTFFFNGYTMSGIPKFPTAMFQQYKWVPKSSLAKYFSDQYFQKTIKLAQHSF